MPAFLIADETITDPEQFDAYKRAVLPLIVKHGGRFLSRGADAELLETGSGWTPGRLVIIEFPSMEALKGWYDSPEYAPVRDMRLGAAKSTLVALDTGTA